MSEATQGAISMLTFRFTARLLVGLLIATFFVRGSAVAPVGATLACPTAADSCLFVNSNTDSNARDGLLTLREAALLVKGDLAVGVLDTGEMAQVVLNSPYALTGLGADDVYFDPVVFEPSSPGHVIQLASTVVLAVPPDLGKGPGGGGSLAVGGDAFALRGAPAVVLDAPPDIGRGPGGGGVLGMGWDPVTAQEVPAAVVIDGSQLAPGAACLRVERPGSWVRGLTLSGCPTAIQVVGDAVGTTLIGTNGDNVNDEYEAVVY
jgi:hypothetical protein